MRLRHIKGCETFVAESPDVVQDPEKIRGTWRLFFENNRPIELEIGMGKGRFLRELSLRDPEKNYLGLERFASVLMKALQRKTAEDEKRAQAGEEKRKNLYYIYGDAEKLPEYFSCGEVSKIYLNFSDPWPKKSHAKRRLTSPDFLKIYEKILAPEGTVEFKTDNTELFLWSVENIPLAGWNILYETRDLHDEPENRENIMTEYEAKFSDKGQKICKLIMKPAEKIKKGG